MAFEDGFARTQRFFDARFCFGVAFHFDLFEAPAFGFPNHAGFRFRTSGCASVERFLLRRHPRGHQHHSQKPKSPASPFTLALNILRHQTIGFQTSDGHIGSGNIRRARRCRWFVGSGFVTRRFVGCRFVARRVCRGNIRFWRFWHFRRRLVRLRRGGWRRNVRGFLRVCPGQGRRIFRGRIRHAFASAPERKNQNTQTDERESKIHGPVMRQSSEKIKPCTYS
jgi:hypothetical protein